MISTFSSQMLACPVSGAPPPLLIPHFGVRLEGDLSQKRSKSLLLIGPLRVDVATCCDENQIFRQEVDAALVSSVENLSVGSCVGNVAWGWTLSVLCVSFVYVCSFFHTVSLRLEPWCCCTSGSPL